MQHDNIQSLGGKARAEKLSAEQKREIASKAAVARWAARPLIATHKGSFQKDFGIDVDCYVLNDPTKTAVISQGGMARAIGLSSGGGNVFPRFLNSQIMQATVGAELRNKITQPIKFQWAAEGAEHPPTNVNGFDVGLLIDLCRAIVQAESEGKLLDKRHAKVIAQSHVILSAAAKAGIRNLVYALAGYNPTAEQVIEAFKLYVQEEAKKYEKEFPQELYAQWQRLYRIDVPERGKPWHFKHLTVNHIYFPLAKSNGKILELARAQKANGGDRQKKLFQFLSEVGTRALRMHMGRVLEMAESSKTKDEYKAKILHRFGGEEQLDLLFPEQTTPEA